MRRLTKPPLFCIIIPNIVSPATYLQHANRKEIKQMDSFKKVYIQLVHEFKNQLNRKLTIDEKKLLKWVATRHALES